MTRTRVLAALVAGLTVAGIGTAATALGSDGPGPAAAPVAVVAGAAARTATTTSSPTSTPTSTTPTSTTRAPGADVAVPADEAGRIAVRHLGGGTVTSVESDTEHGRRVWELDVSTGAGTTRVHVDTATGVVSRVDERDDRGRDDRGRDDRGRDDDSGRHGGDDDGPGHDLTDDRGGDR